MVFTAAQVWTDNEKARAEIDREASALRSAAILATSFPSEFQVQLRELIRRYIADVAAQEWPLMAQGTANLRAIPGVLAEALQATLALNPSHQGQKTAQRDIATAFNCIERAVSASTTANCRSICSKWRCPSCRRCQLQLPWSTATTSGLYYGNGNLRSCINLADLHMIAPSQERFQSNPIRCCR